MSSFIGITFGSDKSPFPLKRLLERARGRAAGSVALGPRGIPIGQDSLTFI